GINDSLRSLDAVASRAAAAGASFLGAHPLFLKSCSRPTWMEFVRRDFPALANDYVRRYARSDFADADYKKKMAEMVRSVCRKHRIGERDREQPLENLLKSIDEAQPEPAPRKEPEAVQIPDVQALLFA